MAFTDDLKKYVDLAVDKSRVAFGKGKAAVSKFGDDSATKIEKLQFEKKLQKEIATLGKIVVQCFVEEKKDSISASDTLVAASLRTITELQSEIARRDALLAEGAQPEQSSVTDAAVSAENAASAPADTTE